IQEVLAVLSQKMKEFAHNGRVGAFRTWLRSIAAYKLGDYLRSQRRRAQVQTVGDQDALLEQLADPASDLCPRWEREHAQHVAQALLELTGPQFAPATWEAFHRLVIEGQPTAAVAAGLGLTTNAVQIARSRVLARLRQEWECWQEN